MAKLIVIGGISRVGKDSAADALVKSYGFRKVNMADFMKRTVEQQYGLPEGALEDDPYRNQPLPWQPKRTYLDLMISLAKTWRESDPNCMVFPYFFQVTELALKGQSVVTTGLRFLNELEVVYKIAKENWFSEVEVWKVSKPGVTPKPSDVELDKVWASIPSKAPYTFRELNNVFPSVEQWQEEIRQVYERNNDAMETQGREETVSL